MTALAPSFKASQGGEKEAQFEARVLDIEQIGETPVWRLRLEKPDGFSFEAGQFTKIVFPGQAPRIYSIASGPKKSGLEFHVLRNGTVSDFVADELKAGDPVFLSPAQGAAFNRRGDRPVLIVAENMYVTPALSVLDDLLADKKAARPVRFVWQGAEKDIHLTAADLKARVAAPERLHVKTGPEAFAETPLEMGNHDGFDCYISASESTTRLVAGALKTLGVPRGRIQCAREKLVNSIYGMDGMPQPSPSSRASLRPAAA